MVVPVRLVSAVVIEGVRFVAQRLPSAASLGQPGLRQRAGGGRNGVRIRFVVSRKPHHLFILVLFVDGFKN